jgi:hypothetical protein
MLQHLAEDRLTLNHEKVDLDFTSGTGELIWPIMDLTVDCFKNEMTEALRHYEKYVVCLDKTPDQCEAALASLMAKAIKAYENRATNLRHGIALDKQTTIILSQTDGDRPLCGIYFNLHSPYQKRLQSEPASS